MEAFPACPLPPGLSTHREGDLSWSLVSPLDGYPCVHVPPGVHGFVPLCIFVGWCLPDLGVTVRVRV